MKRILGVLFLTSVLAGCPTAEPGPPEVEPTPDASADADVMADAAHDTLDASADVHDMTDAAGDAERNECTAKIDVVLAGGCTRCWPATRALCTLGRSSVVDGMTACLTTNACWDLFDPNTAGPCMQPIIDANADAQVNAVQSKLTSLACPSWDILGSSALVAMMSDPDRLKFATCVSALTTCDSNALGQCTSGTAFDESLCKN